MEKEKSKRKSKELQCYINGPKNLSVSKTFLIEASIIALCFVNVIIFAYNL